MKRTTPNGPTSKQQLCFDVLPSCHHICPFITFALQDISDIQNKENVAVVQLRKYFLSSRAFANLGHHQV